MEGLEGMPGVPPVYGWAACCAPCVLYSWTTVVPPVLLSVVPLSVRQEGLVFVPPVSMARLPVVPCLYFRLLGVLPVP